MKRILTTFAVLCLIFGLTQAQTTLISWTFPSGTNSDSMPETATSANTAYALRTVGGTSLINYSTNGLSSFSAQATGWDNGMNTKYWYIRLNTAGFSNLRFSGILRSGGNNPGPRDFALQYRLNPGGTWTDISGSAVICGNNWTSGVLNNLSLPAILDNQPEMIELRWVMTSNTNANGATVASNGITKLDNLNIVADPVTNPANLSGHITYANSLASPLGNVLVTLSGNGIIPQSIATDSQGYFSFSGVAPGNYTLTCQSTSPWGGGGSNDALMVLHHYVGNSTLTGINLVAADPNNTGYVNSADALEIAKRFVEIISSFSRPDWIFEAPQLNIPPTGTTEIMIKGICTGDVNGSYIPQ